MAKRIDIDFLPHQLRLFNSPERIKGLYCGRGAGKSYLMIKSSALDIIQGKRIIYFCQTNNVMETQFLPFIKETLVEWGYDVKVNEKKHVISVGGKGCLFYYSYENYENSRGATKILKIYFDEIALAPKPSLLFAAVAPCMRDSGGRTELIFASTPKKGTEWDKWVKAKTPTKFVITGVTMDDNPKATEEEKQLIKDLVNDPNFYRQEILGEILDDDLEFCVVHSEDFPKMQQPRRGFVSIGCDCAGTGRDDFHFVAVDDSGMIEDVCTNLADTHHQYSIVRNLVHKYSARQINIDVTGGFGNGLYDMCNRAFIVDGYEVDTIGTNFGQSAEDNKAYANARAEMYFRLGDAIRNGFFVDSEKAREELKHTTYDVTSGGKIQLVKKDEIKALIGRSPDTADALALAVYKRGEVAKHADASAVASAFLRAFGH